MGTTAQKLQNIIDAKNAISAVIETYGGTVPYELSGYAAAIEELLNPPPPPLDPTKTYAYYVNGTSSEVDIVGTLNSSAIPNIGSAVKIVIGTKVTSLGQDSLQSQVLSSITIPDTVTSIGRGVFWECYALSSIQLPNNLTSIGRSCFGNCTALKSLDIPASVTFIDTSAFQSCSSLSSVTFEQKTMSQVQTMSNYAWDIFSGSGVLLICSDGTITR